MLGEARRTEVDLVAAFVAIVGPARTGQTKELSIVLAVAQRDHFVVSEAGIAEQVVVSASQPRHVAHPKLQQPFLRFSPQ